MSVWTTKTLNSNKEYVVLRHTLKGINGSIQGVKFRDSYAVVEKNSKVYHSLKKVPVLIAATEYPLIFLKNLPFITRSNDIKTVYGQEVYTKYLLAEKAFQENEKLRLKAEKLKLDQEQNEKREEELSVREELIKKAEETGEDIQIPEIIKCCFRTQDGTLCNHNAVDYSLSNYCEKHLIEDPKLVELDLAKPKYMTKKEKIAFKNKARTAMIKAKKSGKF
jgi:hypothetical protein